VRASRAAVAGVEVLDEAHTETPERQRPGLGLAVGVAGVGQKIGDRDARGDHALDDGHERGRRVHLAGGQLDAAHELGGLLATLVPDRGGHLQVVAEEGLLCPAAPVSAAVSPGGLGVGAGAVLPRRAGEALEVGPVHGVGARGGFAAGPDALLEQPVEDLREALGGGAVGLLSLERPGHQREGTLDLAVGEAVWALPPLGDHPEPELLGLGQRGERLVHPRQVGGAPVEGAEQHA
jgi:hypothetical protein